MTAQRSSRQLILVKHSLPEIVRGVPPEQWRLSDTGRRLCGPLGRRLAPYRPHRIFSSREPKARETARLLGDFLEKPIEVVDGLEEHDRSGVGWLEPEMFDRSVASLFAEPARLVFGRETANQAHVRFAAAIDRITASEPDTVLVVSHGTVISLFVSRAARLEPFGLWKRLGLPSFVVLSLPDLKLDEVVGNLEMESS